MNKILLPKDELELSEMVAQCAAEDIGLRIQGGGTRLALGNLVNAAQNLSLQAISGIQLYDAGALTLIAKAGTPYSDIETLLAAEGQRLAFEPMDHRGIFSTQGEPTIGAMAACNISGSRRVQVGACRDALIGVRFVNGSGEIIKNGGRVMKNVTGLDLVKLMAGAFGTLGILTEVAFKTLPIPERQVTLRLNCRSITDAVEQMSKALTSPFEVTGAAYLPHAEQINLRIEGFDSQVQYRLKKLIEIVGDGQIVEAKVHDDLWQAIRNVDIFSASDKPLWCLSVKPSDAPEIGKILGEQTQADLMFDWGGGLIWAQMPNLENAHADIVRGLVARFGGHATLVRASNALKTQHAVFQPQSNGVEKISQSIRQKFDPSGILNFGLMGN